MPSAFSLKYSHSIGIVAMEGRGFSNPVDVAIRSDGRMYVLSRTNPLQTYGIRVGICGLQSEYYGDFGSYGPGDGQFVWPTALAFDRDDNLYLADEYNHRISVFDGSGRFLSRWGTHGSGDGELHAPSGLAFDADDNLYVVDSRNSRVQKFTKEGAWLLSWGTEGGGAGEFNLPWGVCLDSQGHVYVADWRNDRVQKFLPDGTFVASFGEPGHDDGQFHRPSSVAVDGAGHVYVADWGNERVQVLDADGRFLQRLRGEATLSVWATQFYEANWDEKAAREASELMPKMTEEVATAHEESARVEPYFWGPISVKLDEQGRLYVVESNRHRIQIYARAP